MGRWHPDASNDADSTYSVKLEMVGDAKCSTRCPATARDAK